MAGIKIKTQRSNTYNLIGGQLNTIDFIDTKPSTFQIRNFTADLLFISDSPNVKSTLYEMQIPSNGATGVYVNPKGLTTLYIYANATGTVKIISFESDETYSNDLDKTTQQVNQSVTATSVSINAPIPAGANTIGNVNITGNLPAGANNIGKVDINSIPEVEIKNDVGNPISMSIATLPAGVNNIGKVDINSVPTALGTPTTPTITNTVCTTSGTEYSAVIPAGTRKFTVGNSEVDAGTIVSVYFAPAAANVWKFTGDLGYGEDSIYFAVDTTIYFKCSIAARTIQIISYK